MARRVRAYWLEIAWVTFSLANIAAIAMDSHALRQNGTASGGADVTKLSR